MKRENNSQVACEVKGVIKNKKIKETVTMATTLSTADYQTKYIYQTGADIITQCEIPTVMYL